MRTLLQIFVIVTAVVTVMGQDTIPEALTSYNLDLPNFKFMKAPGVLTPNGLRLGVENPTMTQRAQAFLRYFGNIFMTRPRPNFGVKFDVDKALKLRPAYIKQFGHEGKNLVALIGNGHSAKELRYYGAIGRDFEPFK